MAEVTEASCSMKDEPDVDDTDDSLGEELDRSPSSHDEHWDMQDGRDKELIKDTEARDLFLSMGMSSTYEGCGINSGKLLAWSLPRDDEDFLNIQEYVTNGQGPGQVLEIQSVIRIIANADYYRDFDEPQHQGKLRMMLFHGTKKETVVSILQNGLVLPKSRGQMFGSGIYFADRAAKSFGYTGSTPMQAAGLLRRRPLSRLRYEGYLFLCEILLGNVFEAEKARTSLTAPPEGFDSVKGLGRSIPDPQHDKVVDGVVWPLGPTVDNTEKKRGFGLLWNEYIVYKSTQVQPRYLIKFVQRPELKKKK